MKLKVVLPTDHGAVIREFITHPKSTSRGPVSSDVPKRYSEDYSEACLVLADSPKASAALSRRVLQNLLRNEGGARPGNLMDEIQQVLPKLPSYLQHIDAIRQIGNLSAHPMKDSNTGAILDVEPGEAEWLLDAVEELFDFYFVQPAIVATKKAELNKKLVAAGKAPMP